MALNFPKKLQDRIFTFLMAGPGSHSRERGIEHYFLQYKIFTIIFSKGIFSHERCENLMSQNFGLDSIDKLSKIHQFSLLKSVSYTHTQ